MAFINNSRKIIASAVAISPKGMSTKYVPINDFDFDFDNDSNLNQNDHQIEINEMKVAISRIWVDQKYRRQHLASHLINLIRFSFIPRKEILKKEISFSPFTSADFQLFLQSFLQSSFYLLYY